MIFGASTFMKNINNLPCIVDSIEYYIPRLELYEGRTINKEKVKYLVDLIKSFNLDYSTVHGPYHPGLNSEYPKNLIIDLANMNDKDVKLIKEVVDLTVKFNASILTLHPGRIHNNDNKKSEIEMCKNLDIIVNYAEDCGILIGIENKEGTDKQNLGCNSKELINIIKTVNSNNLGIVFDIGHANLTCNGNQNDLQKYLDDLKKYIIHTHIHDNFGNKNNPFNGDLHLCPGNGTINYKILSSISKKDIVFNFELFNIDEIIEGKKYILNIFSH